ncbi:MAG: DMT family transporter [Rubrobacter sp.]|nr:DMT family transporter [Rubrobacter sp.]MDQ3639306.1 DMT family transporter [Actinomycetota bacterium]
MRPGDLGALTLLGALWGGSFLFISVAVPALGPALLVELRVLLAAVALALCAVAVGRLPALRSQWKEFLILGGLNAAAPFMLIAISQLNLTASLAAIMNSTTPLFAAVVAAAWIGEELTTRKIFGLLLGVVGVVVLVGLDPVPLNGVVLLSVGASLLAALCYALGGVYAKRTFPGVPPLAMGICQQAAAAAILLPLAAANLPGEPPSFAVVLSVLGLALLSTAVAYLIYFRLMASVGPTKTLTVTFLVPVFGVLFGVLLLGDPVGVGTFAGMGIILSSVALVTGISLGRAKEKGA